jgi:orotate phosphoribosyltransferase
VTDATLARAVLDAKPFTTQRRSDGLLLTDYFDGHRVLGRPQTLSLLAAAIADKARTWNCDFVAGEISAGSSLATAVALHTLDHGKPMAARGLRRDSKAYGVPGRLTTPVPPGSSFLLVDDVAGTGDALERCTVHLQQDGHHVVGAIVVLNREQGATERLAALGVSIASVVTLDTLKELRDA